MSQQSTIEKACNFAGSKCGAILKETLRRGHSFDRFCVVKYICQRKVFQREAKRTLPVKIFGLSILLLIAMLKILGGKKKHLYVAALFLSLDRLY